MRGAKSKRRAAVEAFAGPFTPEHVRQHIRRVAAWKSAVRCSTYWWPQEKDLSSEPLPAVHILDPESVRWNPDDGFGIRVSEAVGYIRPEGFRERIAEVLPVRAMVLFAWLTGVNTVAFTAGNWPPPGSFGWMNNMDGYHVHVEAGADRQAAATWATQRLSLQVPPAEALLAVYLHECGHVATIHSGQRGGLAVEESGETVCWEMDADAWTRAALIGWRAGVLASFGGGKP